MLFTRILLSVVLVLFASTALAAKPEKTLVCHVGNEYGPEGQIYDPTCEPDEFYDCSADAGKVDLITISKKAKHIGNPAHSFEDDTGYLWEDYSPEDGVGDEAADFEEGDVVGIDRGCELLEELEKIVFVTSGTYTGDLVGAAGALGLGTFNGLEAGDAICNYHAINTTGGDALPGTYTAWLSDSTINASDRISHSTVPYVRVDTMLVADDWADLTDGTLDNPINITEAGVEIFDPFLRTNTKINGVKQTGVDVHVCSDYTATSGLDVRLGEPTKFNSRWTEAWRSDVDQGGQSGSCDQLRRLYCFQD